MERRQQQYYRDCLDLSLPSIYHYTSFEILDLIHMIWHHHPLSRALSPHFHFDVCFYLFTMFFVMCFIAAVLFDHFVFLFGRALSCKKRESIFSCTEHKDDLTCFWNAAKQLCTTKYSSLDADNIIWSALFLSLICIPVSFLIWYWNLYLIQLLSSKNLEFKTSQIVTVSEETINNPKSSTNRNISQRKNTLNTIIHQEYTLFCKRLEFELILHKTFQSVWSSLLGEYSSLFALTKDPKDLKLNSSPEDIEVGKLSDEIILDLTQKTQYSLNTSDIKRMLSLSLLRTRQEIKKQISLEMKFLGMPRSSAILPQMAQPQRNQMSMIELRHHPGQPLLDHFEAHPLVGERRPSNSFGSLSPSSSLTSLTQANRKYCETIRTSRQLFLLLTDFLPFDARLLLDFQIYIRSHFSSIYADPYDEFHDVLHFPHVEWKSSNLAKAVFLIGYILSLVFMIFYFILFLISCCVEKKYETLSLTLATISLWMVFSIFIMQPFVTILVQYVIPLLITADIHAARRAVLKILNDHSFHAQIKESYQKELREMCPDHQSFDRLPSLPPEYSPSSSQLLSSAQRFSSEYHDSVESSLILKYQPLSALCYPLLQLYILPPYTIEMMRLLLDIEHFELATQEIDEDTCSKALQLYFQSNPTASQPQTELGDEEPQDKKVVEPQDVSHDIPVCKRRSKPKNLEQIVSLGPVDPLTQQEKFLEERIESKKNLSEIFTVRRQVALCISWYDNLMKQFQPKSSAAFHSNSSLFSSHFVYANLLIQLMLLIFLVFLVQFHEVLFFIHPILILAPIVSVGWICVVYYCVIHTSRRNHHNRDRRDCCHCVDRQLSEIPLTVLLQCACPDCQLSNSFGFRADHDCDYCHVRPSKPILLDMNILNKLSTMPFSPGTEKHLLDSVEPESPYTNRRKSRETSPSTSTEYGKHTDSPELSPDYHLSSPIESQLSHDEDSSLESSGDVDPIVIRMPGKKDFEISSKDRNSERKMQDWVNESKHSDWNDIPDQEVLLESSENLTTTISPTMLDLFSDSTPQTPIAQQPYSPLIEHESPKLDSKSTSIDSYIKALEVRENFQTERMSLYQDMILQKTAAKLNLKKNRKLRSSGGNGQVDEVSSEQRGPDVVTPRGSSRGADSNSTLATLKNRLIKSTGNETVGNGQSDSPSRAGIQLDETKETFIRSRVVKTEFETHVASLQENIEKEKFRSQELLAKRLQNKRATTTSTNSS